MELNQNADLIAVFMDHSSVSDLHLEMCDACGTDS